MYIFLTITDFQNVLFYQNSKTKQIKSYQFIITQIVCNHKVLNIVIFFNQIQA